jgi:hypothetical protein
MVKHSNCGCFLKMKKKKEGLSSISSMEWKGDDHEELNWLA